MPASQAQSAWPLQKPQQLVYIELGVDNGGMMLGICEQGLSFRAVSPLKTEGPVNFTFALDSKTRLQGIGELVWSEDSGKTGGLKFTAVSPEFQEALRTWLASESTPKNVGREVTPAAALPLDNISKQKSDIRSTSLEEAKPTEPPLPARAKPFEAKPAEQIQPMQAAHQVEADVSDPAPPKIEQEPVEATPEPVANVEPEPSSPSAPEPELQTAAPLPSAQPQTEPTFSLPNFRLPSATVPPAPAVEKVETGVDISPVETSPAVPISPKISLPEPPARQTEVVSLEIEIPASPHETTLQDFLAEDLVQESPRLNRAVATGIISLALAVILAALVLSFRRDVGGALIYLGEKLAGEERKPAPAQQPVLSTAPVQNSQSSVVTPEKSADKSTAQSLDEPAPSQPQSSETATETPSTNSTGPNVSTSNSFSSNGVQRIQDLPRPASGGSGQKEFEQARAILKGNHRQRDLSFAVNLLWTGVGKGYVPAEVTLADLYARGDGVARSCAQARILLEAAVQKGSPEGRRRLGQLKRHGCP